MKLERLISMIYKLLNHEVVSASTLAEEFQVSPRTIYRDIDVICAAGFPVISYQGNKGGFGMMDGYKMDKSLLGSYDVATLITVLSSLSSVFEDERAQGTIERLQTVGTEHQASSLAVDLETRRTDPDVLPHLRTAIMERNIVRFDYVNAKNERTTRAMEPVKLHFKYGNWYIYGYCRTRRDYREFRLTRMMNVLLTPDTFQPHHEFTREVGFSNSTWQDEVEEVVIRVGPQALAEALDQFHQVDKQFHADGSMTMRIPVDRPLQASWLRSILLSFGSGAEVLEPPALRDILKEQLQNTLKLYEVV
ncbi:WYL domain-containing protein [Paenibacillus sp. HJL G12]|uniref:WYL domain-containing protein n=1 Tax=Paenibacillus dendrobii TaxID=2691084 RepID=A0A7X3IF01_9BACL|nr:YafY family protein [Paenibacillus dendrobii]MWV42693.1 WYL domain-containing protein [Paenibacillus dendrobii]